MSDLTPALLTEASLSYVPLNSRGRVRMSDLTPAFDTTLV